MCVWIVQFVQLVTVYLESIVQSKPVSTGKRLDVKLYLHGNGSSSGLRWATEEWLWKLPKIAKNPDM